jgi:hypothetical protein
MKPIIDAVQPPRQEIKQKLPDGYRKTAALFNRPLMLFVQFWFWLFCVVLTRKGLPFGPLTVLDTPRFIETVPAPLLF